MGSLENGKGSFASERENAWENGLSLPGGLRESLGDSRMELMARQGGLPVPVRIFGGSGGKTPIIISHGLQSHSGWFAQSASFIAKLGHPCYVFDRRGSGLSKAARGDVKAYGDWAMEIGYLAQELQQLHGHGRVYLMGHCFGVIPAALFADRNPERVRGLILASPALHVRITLPAGHLLRIFLTLPGRRSYYLPVPLETEWFTDLDDYRLFIAGDPIALRKATGNFYWQLFRARTYLRKSRSRIGMPVWAGTAGADPIGDNKRNLEWISRLPSTRKTLVHYPAARHVLEFSTEQEAFFKDLAAWLEWIELL